MMRCIVPIVILYAASSEDAWDNKNWSYDMSVSAEKYSLYKMKFQN